MKTNIHVPFECDFTKMLWENTDLHQFIRIMKMQKCLIFWYRYSPWLQRNNAYYLPCYVGVFRIGGISGYGTGQMVQSSAL